MKNLIFLFSLLMFSGGFAQDTLQTRNNKKNDRAQQRSNQTVERTRQNQQPVYQVRDREEFTSNREKYTFTRDGNNGMNISRRNQSGQEENFGRLKRTTTDGFYIMTSTPGQDVSFGQFDPSGNFRTYRYDAANDTVVEQEFINSEPMEFDAQRARQMRRTNTNSNSRGNNRRNP